METIEYQGTFYSYVQLEEHIAVFEEHKDRSIRCTLPNARYRHVWDLLCAHPNLVLCLSVANNVSLSAIGYENRQEYYIVRRDSMLRMDFIIDDIKGDKPGAELRLDPEFCITDSYGRYRKLKALIDG